MEEFKSLSFSKKDGEEKILDVDRLVLNKYNILYGNNGSGKTTLSRFFHNIKNLSTEDLLKEYQELEFGNIKTPKDAIESLRNEYENEKTSIAVFNSDFIEKNVFQLTPSGKKNSLPILVLGEDMKEKLIEKAKLVKDKTDLQEKSWYKNNYRELTKKIEAIESDLSGFANLIKLNIGDISNDGFTKLHLKKYLTSGANSLNPIKSAEEYEKKLKQFQSYKKNPKQEIDSLGISQLPSLFSNEFILNVQSVLGSEVLGNTLDELKNDTDLLAWFTQGYKLHNEHNNTQECKYCKQEISEDRLTKIKDHFLSNISVIQKECTTLLDICKKNLTDVNNYLSQFGLKINSEDILEDTFKSKLYSTVDYDKHRQNLQNWCIEYKNLASDIESKLTLKISNPYSIDVSNFDILSATSALDKAITTICSEVITPHNKFITEVDGTKSNLNDYRVFQLITPENPHTIEKILNEKATELQEYLISIGLNHQIQIELIKDFITNSSTIEKTVRAEAEKIIKDIDTKLADINCSLKNYQTGLTEINKIIEKIIGDKFTLVEHNDAYAVNRSNKCLSTLSEGEKTILAIAYFFADLKSEHYKHTYPSGSKLDKKILLVIDDPISSLDDSNIYMVCGFLASFLREHNERIKQFVLLTHRFSVGKIFTKILSNYRKNRKSSDRNQADLFTIKNGSIAISAEYENFFENEYSQLFQQVISWSKEPSTINNKNKYLVANVCRKVLEAFSHFKIGQGFEGLNKQFSGIDLILHEANKRSANIHSHLRFDAFEDLDEDAAKHFPKIVCDIIIECDQSHYESFITKAEQNNNKF